MKLKIVTLLFGAVFSTGVLSHGSRGGGEFVNVAGNPELRDLVEKTNCLWVEGSEMIKTAPKLKVILDKLAEFDWYFAAELRSEINYLSYCQTSELMKIDTSDEDSLHRGVAVGKESFKQLGIRLNSDVYVDMKIYNNMSESSKAYFLIHEAMHSYLDWDLKQRNQKLRSIVKAIESINNRLINSRKEFHLQMRKNDVQFPLIVGQLSRFKAQIEYLLSTEDERRIILSKIQDIQAFMKKINEIDPEILPEYQRRLLMNSTNWIEKIRYACEEGDLNSFVFYTKLQGDDSRSLGICASSLDLSDSSRLSKYVLEKFHSGEFTDKLLSKLSGKKFNIRQGRLYAEQAISAISENPQIDSQVFLKLNAAKNSSDLSAEFMGLSSLIAYDLSIGHQDYINRIVFNHPSFRSVFGIKEAIQEIDLMVFSYPREKELGLKRLPLFYQFFWDLMIEQVKLRASDDNANWFKEKINDSDLGYKI